jgi:hypothetical protein
VQTAERPEFEDLIARLCAEYGQPCTKARKDAYWAGLAKMSVAQLTRCVDFAVGEHGPDDLPTAKGLWKLYRQLRAPEPSGVHTSAREPQPAHLTFWANRLLYTHIASRGGLGAVELEACQKLKGDLVAWFVGPIREADPDTTPAEFLRQWIAGLQEISRIEQATYARWCAMLEDPQMAKPFEPSMARELGSAAAA